MSVGSESIEERRHTSVLSARPLSRVCGPCACRTTLTHTHALHPHDHGWLAALLDAPGEQREERRGVHCRRRLRRLPHARTPPSPTPARPQHRSPSSPGPSSSAALVSCWGRRGERERGRVLSPAVDRARGQPSPRPLSLSFHAGLALPLVVPPLREATAKPAPTPVVDLIAKASAN